MRSSIRRLSAHLLKTEELFIEFRPQYIELTIARTDARLNGEEIYVTRYISLEELCASTTDLLQVIFEYTLENFRKGCRELGLYAPVQFRLPSQETAKVIKSWEFLNQIQNHPPKEPKDEI